MKVLIYTLRKCSLKDETIVVRNDLDEINIFNKRLYERI